MFVAVPLVVVGAAILHHGRLLGARRSAPVGVAGSWELPGGKVDPGECPEQALIRECREELGVEIVVGRRIGGDWPVPGASRPMVLRIWTAGLLRGQPRPLQDHSEVRWLAPDRFDQVVWLPADRPVVAWLRRLMVEGDLLS
jgi:8-oxo-dGTP diphosphatase